MLSRAKSRAVYTDRQIKLDDRSDDGVYQFTSTDNVQSINFDKPISVQGVLVSAGGELIETLREDISRVETDISTVEQLIDDISSGHPNGRQLLAGQLSQYAFDDTDILINDVSGLSTSLASLGNQSLQDVYNIGQSIDLSAGVIDINDGLNDVMDISSGYVKIGNNTLYVDIANNRVGINTLPINEDFEIAGNLQLDTGNQNKITFYDTANDHEHSHITAKDCGDPTTGRLEIYTNSGGGGNPNTQTPAGTFTCDNRLFINKEPEAGNYHLDVCGQIQANDEIKIQSTANDRTLTLTENSIETLGTNTALYLNNNNRFTYTNSLEVLSGTFNAPTIQEGGESLDEKYAQLNVANTFTQNQELKGTGRLIEFNTDNGAFGYKLQAGINNVNDLGFFIRDKDFNNLVVISPDGSLNVYGDVDISGVYKKQGVELDEIYARLNATNEFTAYQAIEMNNPYLEINATSGTYGEVYFEDNGSSLWSAGTDLTDYYIYDYVNSRYHTLFKNDNSMRVAGDIYENGVSLSSKYATVSSLSAVEADVADVSSQLNSLESTVNTNTSNISTNTSNISTNTSNISTNTSNISTNTSNISTNTSNIATNTSDIATNTSNISTNTSNISTNTSNIATNTSNIATNTSNISSNSGSIIFNAQNISSNSGRITTLENENFINQTDGDARYLQLTGGTLSGDLKIETSLTAEGKTIVGTDSDNFENELPTLFFVRGQNRNLLTGDRHHFISSSTDIEATGNFLTFNIDDGTTADGTSHKKVLTVEGTGNVGIGTNNPSAKLDVEVESNNDGLEIQYLGTGGIDRGGAISFFTNDLTSGTPRTGIGKAQIKCGKQNNSNGNDSVYLSFSTRVNDTATREQMRITDVGDVGVGTTVPQARMEIQLNSFIFSDSVDNGNEYSFFGQFGNDEWRIKNFSMLAFVKPAVYVRVIFEFDAYLFDDFGNDGSVARFIFSKIQQHKSSSPSTKYDIDIFPDTLPSQTVSKNSGDTSTSRVSLQYYFNINDFQTGYDIIQATMDVEINGSPSEPFLAYPFVHSIEYDGSSPDHYLEDFELTSRDFKPECLELHEGILHINRRTTRDVEDGAIIRLNGQHHSGIYFEETAGINNATFYIRYDGAGAGAGNYVEFGNNVSGWTSDHMYYIPQNGYLGIGVQNPSERLHIDGNILTTGNITSQLNSDYARLRYFGVEFNRGLSYLRPVTNREDTLTIGSRDTNTEWKQINLFSLDGYLFERTSGGFDLATFYRQGSDGGAIKIGNPNGNQWAMAAGSTGSFALFNDDDFFSTFYIGADKRAVFKNQVYINYTQDVTQNSDTGGLVIGSKSSTHLAFDNNEIMARSGNADATLFIQNEGARIGINQSTPNCPVEITGSASVGGYSTFNNENIVGQPTSSEQTSLYVNSGIGASYIAFHSDERIKRNIVPINDERALELVRKIESYNYQYKDRVSKGDTHTLGFIAQQVKEHLPNAIKYTNECIPNIYKKSYDFSWCDCGYKKQKLTVNDISFTEGIRYQFIVNEDISSQNITVQTECISGNSFYFKKQYSHVFVYGEEVQDFHIVDKHKIYALHHSAIQEIDKKQRKLIERVERVERSERIETIKQEKQETSSVASTEFDAEDMEQKINLLKHENRKLKDQIKLILQRISYLELQVS